MPVEEKKASADTRAVPESRIAAARALVPAGDVACGLCWTRGRDAAILEMTAGVDCKAVPLARIATARQVSASGNELHDGRSWNRGRDAAVSTMLGEQ